MIRFLSVLSIPLLLPTMPDGDDGQDAPNVLRIYDLGVLELGDFEVNYKDRNSFLPYSQSTGEVEYYDEGDGSDGGEHFVSLLNDLYGPEFEYEGRMIDITDDGKLLVVGPDALHERVSALYSFYEATLNSQALLQFDVVTLRGGEKGPGTALVDPAAADALIAQAASHETFRIAARADRTSMLDLSSTTPMVLDYDVEIAQGAAIGDPIVRDIPDGTRLHLQAAPVAGGMALALEWKHADLISTATRETGLAANINTENGQPRIVKTASRIQTYTLSNRSAGFGCVLPEGRVLALSVSTDAARGGANEVVLVRKVAGGLAARHELSLTSSGARVVIADTGSAVPPTMRAGGTLLFPNVVHAGQPLTINYDTMLTSRIQDNDNGLVLDMMRSVEPDHIGVSEVGRWAILWPGAHALEDGADVSRELDSVLAMLEALAADTRQFSVEISASKGRSQAVKTTLPLRNGTGGVVTLGAESLGIRDYDVEVAQFASVADPQIDVRFDGLALYVKPTLTARGTVMLDVRGGAMLVDKPSEHDLGSEIYRFVDQPEGDHAMVHQRRDVESGADGTWTATFGADGGDGVQITIKLREL